MGTTDETNNAVRLPLNILITRIFFSGRQMQSRETRRWTIQFLEQKLPM